MSGTADGKPSNNPKQIRASKGIYKFLKPVADAYARSFPLTLLLNAKDKYPR